MTEMTEATKESQHMIKPDKKTLVPCSFRNTSVYYFLFYLYNLRFANNKHWFSIGSIGYFLFLGLDCVFQLLIMLVMLLTPKVDGSIS